MGSSFPLCIVLFIIFSLIHPPISNAATAPTPVGQTGTWNLIFDDEFNGTSVELTKWRPNWLGPNDGAITKAVNAKEVGCIDPKQVSVGNGELSITAVARSCNGQPYATGLIESNEKFNFTYGYLESRIFSPGSGAIDNWPAFWANGQNHPVTGELDVFEGLGGKACWHFHNPAGGPGGCAPGSYGGGWHVYGAEWKKGAVTYFYDGQKVGELTSGITDAPMYLIANYGLSSTVSGPIKVPSTMRVDYVRVWQRPGGSSPTVMPQNPSSSDSSPTTSSQTTTSPTKAPEPTPEPPPYSPQPSIWLFLIPIAVTFFTILFY